MSQVEFTNNACEVLGVAINTTGTVANIGVKGALFPQVNTMNQDWFWATISNDPVFTTQLSEIVRCTNIATDGGGGFNVAIERGRAKDGAAPKNWSIGADFQVLVNSELLDDLRGGGSGGGSCCRDFGLDIWVSNPLQAGDDYASVQEALNYLQSFTMVGGALATVHVRPGSYTLLDNDWGYQSSGDNIIIKGDDGSGSADPTTVRLIVPQNSDGFIMRASPIGEIHNLSFEAAAANTSGVKNRLMLFGTDAHARFYNCRFIGQSFNLVDLQNSWALFSKCTFTGAEDSCIEMTFAKVHLISCTFSNSRRGINAHRNSKVQFYNLPDAPYNSVDWDCDISNCTSGIYLHGASKFFTHKKTLKIHDNSVYGIGAIEASFADMEDTQFYSNTTGDSFPAFNTMGDGSAGLFEYGSWVLWGANGTGND